jgi:hypothetical protein
MEIGASSHVVIGLLLIDVCNIRNTDYELDSSILVAIVRGFREWWGDSITGHKGESNGRKLLESSPWFLLPRRGRWQQERVNLFRSRWPLIHIWVVGLSYYSQLVSWACRCKASHASRLMCVSFRVHELATCMSHLVVLMYAMRTS